MEHSEQILKDALKHLKNDIPLLAETLFLGDTANLASWTNIVNGKLLPRLSPDFPLTAAVCGGGSSGKSTLFNSLVGDRLSPSGGSAGINRRILVSAPGELFRKSDFLSTLFEPLGTTSKPLENKEELTVPGCPLYVLNSNAPRNMVLMDTPDFDTGSRGGYVNRDVVRKALETSDILIYIFTNSNYNNRDNTDFISQMLTGLGMRKCFLIYRVYSGFENQEVIRHAMTVARNLYGEHAEKYVLGIYRTDEDNAVAAGEKFMELKPVRDYDPPFMEALKQTDPRTLRPELLSSILESALKKAEEVLAHAKVSSDELRLYLDTLLTVQSQCIREALPHFPVDRVLRRFVEIWLETDPPYIRLMRQTGSIFSEPIKMTTKAVGNLKNKIFPPKSGENPQDDFKEKVEVDLLKVVTEMQRRTVGSEVSVSLTLKDAGAGKMIEAFKRIVSAKPAKSTLNIDFSDEKDMFTIWVPAHPVVYKEQELLRNRDWEHAVNKILSHKDVIIEISRNMESELAALVHRLRSEMGFTDRVRQTFSAFLNVLPATAAVTYILTTGDPIGGAGIKVKLASLFGLNDLYALIAIPATTGLKKADQHQMEAILGPIATEWLNEKLRAVQEIFESEITGGLIRSAQHALETSERLIKNIEENIALCRTQSRRDA